MANTSRQCGLRPIDQPFGNIQVNVYKAQTGVDMYLYQPVQLTAGGSIQICGCATASDVVPLLGSIVGFLTGAGGPTDSNYSYVPAAPASNQLDSSGLFRVIVADNPGQYFVIEEDTGGSALAQTSVGLGGGFTIQGSTTGNTATGIANYVLDRSLTGTAPSSNLPIQLVKLWDKPDNAYGNYAKWIVRIQDHQFRRAVPTNSALI